MWYVYILENPQGHFYVGITTDLSSRLRQHNEGSVSSTQSRRPWKIRTAISFGDEWIIANNGRATKAIKKMVAKVVRGCA